MDLTIITSNSPALKEALRIAREQEQEQEEAEAIVVGGKRKAVTAIEPNKKIRSTIDNIPLDASSKAIADEPGFHLIQHRFNLTTVESDQAFVQLLSERGAGEANDLGSVQLNIIAKKGWSPYTDYLIVVNNAQGVSLLHLDPIEYSRRGIKTKMGGGGLVEALVYLARKGVCVSTCCIWISVHDGKANIPGQSRSSRIWHNPHRNSLRERLLCHSTNLLPRRRRTN